MADIPYCFQTPHFVGFLGVWGFFIMKLQISGEKCFICRLETAILSKIKAILLDVFPFISEMNHGDPW